MKIGDLGQEKDIENLRFGSNIRWKKIVNIMKILNEKSKGIARLKDTTREYRVNL